MNDHGVNITLKGKVQVLPLIFLHWENTYMYIHIHVYIFKHEFNMIENLKSTSKNQIKAKKKDKKHNIIGRIDLYMSSSLATKTACILKMYYFMKISEVNDFTDI